jgi:malate dehydrogenase
MNAPLNVAVLNVAVTGAAGNIGYALLFRLASGDCYGKDQPIRLRLLEITPAMKALDGVVMELEDAAFPLLQGVHFTDDPAAAFDGVNQAFLVGSRPRTKDMDRADLIRVNGPIFTTQGKALNERAASDIRVLVVGNPCNTNALIAMNAARDIPRERFAAMTRLDQNRARSQVAARLGVNPSKVRRLAVWGNHSNTMFPDWLHADVDGVPLTDLVAPSWLEGGFLDTVANRGKAIIVARGASSAASAASAAIDHMVDAWRGTPPGDWTSMAVASNGQYGVPEGLVSSFPVVVSGREWAIVEGIEHGELARGRLQATIDELSAERAAVKDLIGA